MLLRNRVALVTGGSRGIGRGIAHRMAREGARVAFAYRANKAAAQTALRQMQAAGADCLAVETDVRHPGRGGQQLKTGGEAGGGRGLRGRRTGRGPAGTGGPTREDGG